MVTGILDEGLYFTASFDALAGLGLCMPPQR
jgi:hypothetical protein